VKILFVNQFYWPDFASTAQMLSDLAPRLAAKGHEVHVLATAGKYEEGTASAQPLPRRQVHKSVHVHRAFASRFGKRSNLGRLLDYLGVHLSLGVATLRRARRFDVVVSLTTPPLIGVYAGLARRISHTRHVCWVMDLHPDCEFELGVFSRRRFVFRALERLNDWHLRRADRCVVLGEDMAERLRAKGVDDARLRLIPVWGHPDSEEQGSEQSGRSASVEAVSGGGEGPGNLRGATSVSEAPSRASDRFVAMYSGNAGLIHSFSEICEAAQTLADDSRFLFRFVGGGRRLREIQAFREAHGLSNIETTGYVPRERLTESLRSAEVHLVTLRPGMSGVAVPSKLYGILAVARPVIFVGPADSAVARTITGHACGFAVGNDDAAGLVQALRRLADDPELRRSMGRRAFDAFQREFHPDVCAEQWASLLEELACSATQADLEAHASPSRS